MKKKNPVFFNSQKHWIHLSVFVQMPNLYEISPAASKLSAFPLFSSFLFGMFLLFRLYKVGSLPHRVSIEQWRINLPSLICCFSSCCLAEKWQRSKLDSAWFEINLLCRDSDKNPHISLDILVVVLLLLVRNEMLLKIQSDFNTAQEIAEKLQTYE